MRDFTATAKLIAILHDKGKFNDNWQKYLEDSLVKRVDPVPHSPYGSYYLSELVENLIKKTNDLPKLIMKEIISFVILSHHGLFDALTPQGFHQFERRQKDFLKKYGFNYRESILNLHEDYPEELIHQLVIESYAETSNFYKKMQQFIREKGDSKGFDPTFCLGTLMRMLLSVLIDSDWSDAAAFFTDEESYWNDIVKDFSWESLVESLNEKLLTFKSKQEIDFLRRKISEECFESAKRKGGIYKLHVPTGGGKTLAVMRFALEHAKEWNKDRVIYTAPYKSIVDQNAQEYRNALLKLFDVEEGELIILEHHGDVIRTDQDDSYTCKNSEKSELDSVYNYLTSSWHSPVILTTMVQLLNTMFSSNKQSIRRFNSLSNAVLIIDEYQAIPNQCISLFNMMINILTKFFSATVVLCSATQPPFDTEIKHTRTKRVVVPVYYAENANLVNDYSQHPVFRRTQLVDLINKEFGPDDLSEFILDRTQDSQSVLIILNTKHAVQTLFNKLINKNKSDLEVIALSNSMIPVHRKFVLNKIKDYLSALRQRNRKDKLIVISTSLIEAGVDLSFSEVMRSLNGMDIVVQAAGRANRHKECDKLAKVWLIKLSGDWENVSPMEDMVIAQESCIPMVNDFKKNPERYDNDLMSKASLDFYYKEYYREIANKTFHEIEIGNENIACLICWGKINFLMLNINI